MKFIKIFVALLALTISAVKAQFTKAEVQVSGLTCSMCSKSTEKSLRTLPFIGDVKADLNRNVFVLTFKKDIPVDLQSISKKVQGAGFFVNNLNAVFNFDNVKVTNNQFSYAGNSYQFLTAPDKPLSGPVNITVVDKGFVSTALFKKYSAQHPDISTQGIYHLMM